MDDSCKSSEVQACNALKNEIEKRVNREMLGTESNPSQFSVPFDDDKKQIGILKLDNVQVRAMLTGIHRIVELCIDNNAEKDLWTESIGHYAEAMTKLRKRTPFSDDEIWDFQRSADLWFRDWITLHGSEGITNYGHMMGSGHLLEYLQHWRNLSVHSQQGWEAFNSAFKTYYFNRTQRGGAVNKGRGKQSRLLPMARWVQRRTIFMGKYTEDDIRSAVAGLTVEERENSRDWVKNLGGTIEFGQLISDRPSEVAMGAEDERVELHFDYTIGKNSLYEQSLDEAIRNLAYKMDNRQEDSESESSSLADKGSEEGDTDDNNAMSDDESE